LVHTAKISRILIFVIAALITIPAGMLLVSEDVYSATTKADVAIEVQAGFDGVARLGTYIPYKVTLINKGRAVDGEAEIEVKIDSECKTIFSKPVSLAQGASKEITINAPVFTARRSVKVRFTEGRKVIRETDYNFRKLIPPEIKTIGVLSSDNEAYSFLNGLLIPQSSYPEYEEKIKAMIAAGIYTGSPVITSEAIQSGTVNKTESILIPLTAEEMPDDIKVLNGFDILILSNFDTGILSDKQLKAVEEWVESGGTLVIGTGAGWKKVYNRLPGSLKKFTINGTDKLSSFTEIEKFTGSKLTGGVKMDVAVGDIGFEYKKAEGYAGEESENEASDDKNGSKVINEAVPIYSASIDEVLFGDKDMPLAVKYMHQAGRILFLAFDPGMEPVAGWEGREAFWENLLFHANDYRRIYQRSSNYYYSNIDNYYYLNDLASQVPEDRKPPFLFMFVTIGVYIILTGPALYIYLKKKDRRDYGWLAVPAMAFVCLVVVYLVGFKTRYRTAVFNTVSLINLDMQNQKAEITTGMGVFNNKRGDLKLSYSEKDNIEFDITQSGSMNYVVRSDGSEPEGKVVSRLVFTEPLSYELYDVSMWEPKYLSASKSEPFEDKIISSVQIKDGIFRAEINNTTKYDLLEAFLTVGKNFIYIGDIMAGDKKTVEADLNSKDIYRSFEYYLDAMYGRTYYPSPIKPPEDFRQKLRKRQTVERLFQSQYSGIRGQAKIGLYALNNQDLGYDIKINGEVPVSYFTNGIFTSLDLTFEKGKQVDIPSGIILPEIEKYGLEGNIVSIDDENGVRIREKGDIDFVYTLPDGFAPDEFTLKFDTYIPLYVKYNMEAMKAQNSNMQMTILQNKYEYYLYNSDEGSWEQISDNHYQSSDAGKYVDAENKLRVRVRVVELADSKEKGDNVYYEMESLSFPELQLKGVTK